MSDSTPSAAPGEINLAFMPASILLWCWRHRDHGGEPRGPEALRLRRRIRALLARWRAAPPAPRPARRSEETLASVLSDLEERPEMRFLDLLFANAGDAALLDRLRSVPPERRNAALLRYGVKPWRGAAGRAAAGRSKAKGKAGRAARARELHAAGLSNREIADALCVSQKTVQRALKGHRARRRTGGVSRNARGRFGRGRITAEK